MRARHSQNGLISPEVSYQSLGYTRKTGAPAPCLLSCGRYSHSSSSGSEGMPLAFPCALSLPTSTSHNSFRFELRGGFPWEAFPDLRAGLGASSCFHRTPRSPFIILISLCGLFFPLCLLQHQPQEGSDPLVLFTTVFPAPALGLHFIGAQ